MIISASLLSFQETIITFESLMFFHVSSYRGLGLIDDVAFQVGWLNMPYVGLPSLLEFESRVA